MLTPILRLVLIYLVLILAVVGVFNRDKLARLVSGDAPVARAPVRGDPTPLVAAPSAPVGAAPVVQPQPQTAPAQSGALQTPYAAPANPTAPAAQAMGGVSPALAATDASLAEAVNAARNAYWSGDLDGAGAQLAALTETYPDNPDVFGELGNFRLARGDFPGAATAFLRAGELLIDQGRSAQALSVLPVLQQIDPEKAAALTLRLQTQ